MNNGRSPEPTSPVALTTEARQRLLDLAEVLLVGGDGFPTPAEIDIQSEWIDRVLVAWPAITAAVEAVLSMPGEPQGVIEDLQVNQPALFSGFAMAVSAAYLMHPQVRSLLGYPGQTLREEPPSEGEWEYYLEDGILQPVLDRGPFLRPVPGDG